MTGFERLDQVYHTAEVIPFNDSSKIIILSDCHRGDGSWGDNFSKNQNIYFAAMKYYYEKNFTYIEVGDGDELWENRDYSHIISAHSNVFWLLSKFYKKSRLHLLYGNHDMEKKDVKYTIEKCTNYFDEREQKCLPLFPDIEFHEGLILRHKDTGLEVFLTHGHQADPLNDTYWKMARVLVRYLWHPLEMAGFLDPTSAAKNYEVKERVETRLKSWAEKEKKILITGHTHRPVFPKTQDPPYFNDGSCVHPRCITGIEITGGRICLIKWTTNTRKDRSLFVDREVLAGPVDLHLYSSA